MEITLLCLLVNSAALSESVGAGNFQELFSKSVGVLIFQRSLSQLQQSKSLRSGQQQLCYPKLCFSITLMPNV